MRQADGGFAHAQTLAVEGLDLIPLFSGYDPGIYVASAALTADGGSILLGIRGEPGRADWFARGADGQYRLGQTLAPSGGALPSIGFGQNVATDAAGTIVLVGEIQNRVFLFRHGADGVFAPPQVIASGGPSGSFGERVALSADGRTALVLAPQERAPGTPYHAPVGAAYVLDLNVDGRFVQMQRLTAGTVEEFFGVYGALSETGDVVVISGFKHTFIFAT